MRILAPLLLLSWTCVPAENAPPASDETRRGPPLRPSELPRGGAGADGVDVDAESPVLFPEVYNDPGLTLPDYLPCARDLDCPVGFGDCVKDVRLSRPDGARTSVPVGEALGLPDPDGNALGGVCGKVCTERGQSACDPYGHAGEPYVCQIVYVGQSPYPAEIELVTEAGQESSVVSAEMANGVPFGALCRPPFGVDPEVDDAFCRPCARGADCGIDAACYDASRGDSLGAAETGRGTCLPACIADAACPAGFRCEPLPVLTSWSFEDDVETDDGRHRASAHGDPSFGPDRDGDGLAVELDGVDDWIEVNSLHTEFETGSDFALDLWFRSEPVTNNGALFSAHGPGPGNPLVIRVGNTGGILVYAGNGLTYGSGYNDQSWHHLRVSVSGLGRVIVVVDDVEIGNTDEGHASVPWDIVTRVSIGQEWDRGTASDFFHGAIDQLRVSHRHGSVCQPASATCTNCLDGDGDGFGVGLCGRDPHTPSSVDCDDTNADAYYDPDDPTHPFPQHCGVHDFNCNGLSDKFEQVGPDNGYPEFHCTECWGGTTSDNPTLCAGDYNRNVPTMENDATGSKACLWSLGDVPTPECAVLCLEGWADCDDTAGCETMLTEGDDRAPYFRDVDGDG